MFILILLQLLPTTSANSKCSSQSPPLIPKYHLMEKCHRSKLGIAAKANYTTLTSCQRLGIEKKALALNFSPREAVKMMDEGDVLEYTCEVLKCAEADGGLSLVNDTRYDYYSIYAKPLPNINSTCVPATGMFYLVPKRLNYTEARAECKNMSSVLADVTSEQRTDALAAVLSGADVDAAFVGLRRRVNGSSFFNVNEVRAECKNTSSVLADVTSEQRTDALATVLREADVDAAFVGLKRRVNGSSFFNVNGDALDCSTYRAWAPGHPRRHHDKYDCVVITKHRTWQSASCKKRYRVLCELVPGGPYKRRSIFASRKKNETEFEIPSNRNKDKNQN